MKKAQTQTTHFSRVIAYYLLGVLAGILGIVAMARIIWHSKFYPNVMVGTVEVGGLTRAQATAELNEMIASHEITLTYNGYTWRVPTTYFEPLIEQSLNEAYRVGRRLNLSDYALIFIDRPQVFPLALSEGTTPAYEALISEIGQSVEIPAMMPILSVKEGLLNLMNGSDGVIIASSDLLNQIKQSISSLEEKTLEVPTRNISAQLREDQIKALLQRGEALLAGTLTVTHDDEKVVLSGEELLAFLATQPDATSSVDQDKIDEYVVGLSESYNRDPEDAKFEFVDGKVTEFAPGKDGIEVINAESSKQISLAIEKVLSGSEKDVKTALVVARKSPNVTMDKINEYGIKERIGRGESYYAHSIPNRIYNVGLAAERTNSVLVPPGEEYSFNKSVGEISGATGYKTAYVISGGRTVLGDGGGVCQVSTTLFRAAMSAGLPITERWAHAYRVGYYEQNSGPGIDATVYSPSKDLRFLNDTPGHILVQTINDPKELHLVVEIYGTSDGRVATVSEPKVWGITGPLPTIYQDDPSLPAGQLKQVDWAASGAKTSFEYKVTRNGEVLQDKIFTSNYRPWASVYLRGTGQ